MACKRCLSSDYPWLKAATNNHIFCLQYVLTQYGYCRFDRKCIMIEAAINDSLDCLKYCYEQLHWKYEDALSEMYDYTLDVDSYQMFQYSDFSKRIKEYLGKIEDDWYKDIFPIKRKRKMSL